MTLHGDHPASTPSAAWPAGARGAVSLTFDNLGAAAEEELGLAVEPGDHPSVAVGLPIVLRELARTGLPATFFVEGVNAEDHPAAIRAIAEAGHECAYHAWHHEDWSTLTPDQERENLTRGLAALRGMGVEVTGFRPPGGRLGSGTPALLAAHGVTYSSPAGTGAGIGETVLLPFTWRGVDAYHLLAQFGSLRARIDGSAAAGGPEGVAEAMIAAVDTAVADGGHATLILHPLLVEGERAALRAILDHIAGAVARGDLWAARCDAVAAWIARHPDTFAGATQLDDAPSWVA